MLDELRDEAARLCGWERWTGQHSLGTWHNADRTKSVPHPFPYGDLNPIAREWPEGWQIEIDGPGQENGDQWSAGATSVEGAWKSKLAPTEYEARLRLLVAVKKEDHVADAGNMVVTKEDKS